MNGTAVASSGTQSCDSAFSRPNDFVNNYLQHSTNWRSSQWGAFKEELARCQATSGCNVDGVYQPLDSHRQRPAEGGDVQHGRDAGAGPNATTEAEKSFGAATTANSVSPINPGGRLHAWKYLE